MYNIQRFWRIILEFILFAVLVLVLITIFKVFTPTRPAASKPQTQTTQDTLPVATSTLSLPYPPPGDTIPIETANQTAEAEQEAAATATESAIPLATKEEANIVLANTPWPTFTPYPSPTQKPGPTPTPIPLIAPAKNSEGTIVYLARDKDGNKDFNAIAVDNTGMIKSTTTLKTSVKAPEGEIYISPNGSQLAMIGPWGAGAILNIGKGVITPFDEKISLSFEGFFNWFPDSNQALIKANLESLWLANPLNGEFTPLAVPGYGSIGGAAASPDGTKVIYSHRADFTTPDEVWVVNADGRDAKMLFTLPAQTYNFSWSPDGKQIAFFGEGWMVIDADSTTPRKIGTDLGIPQCYFMPPQWSPDSKYLAIVDTTQSNSFCNGWSDDVFIGTSIYLIDIESGKSQPLIPDSSTGNIDPSWSPDGSQIAFTSNRSGSPEIWVINVDGTGLRQMTNNSQYVRYPLWCKP